MSGEQRRSEASQEPWWSLDLLADLHAGALDADTARELDSRVQQDPAARKVLAALDATRADLAGMETPTIPDDVAARITAALANETPPGRAEGRVIDFADARRRRRRLGRGLGLLATAAAVVGIVVVASTAPNTVPEAAGPPPASPQARPPLALTGSQVRLDRAQLTDVLHSHQYSPALSDAQALQACLQANGVNNAKPLGAREVTLDGRPAQLMILPTTTIDRFRLIVVGPDCGPGNPATISDNTFGG
jgi:hypothetical protein